jgi:type III pantothenate kinase
MLSGVLNGSTEEVKGMIEIYRLKYPELLVILCGGDAIFFDSRLKNSIFAHTLKTEPDLVLLGLNEVIDKND